MRCLRKIIHVRWEEHISDTEMLQRSDKESIHAMLMRSQLRWASHVVRMSEERLSKTLFYGELTAGKHSVGRQKKRFKDSFKLSLKRCGINPDTWEYLALDRAAWRGNVHTGVADYEKENQNAI